MERRNLSDHFADNPTFCVDAAHRLELLDQAVNRFRQLWPEAGTEKITGFEAETTADVVVASIQGLSQNLERFSSEQFGYMIIDEAHHAAADSYHKVISYLEVVKCG
jgi:DNA or RNA helicases of superfamily II